MPFVIATTLRIVHTDARTGVQTVRAYVQAYRGLRRDPDPQSPYTGQIVVTSMAHAADTARVFADRAEAGWDAMWSDDARRARLVCERATRLAGECLAGIGGAACA